jgi:hypothetical protein
MSRLSDQLLAIYTAKLYPILAHHDPIYQQVLTKAGLGWVAPLAIPPAHTASSEQEMKMQSWLAARKIEDARSPHPEHHPRQSSRRPADPLARRPNRGRQSTRHLVVYRGRRPSTVGMRPGLTRKSASSRCAPSHDRFTGESARSSFN